MSRSAIKITETLMLRRIDPVLMLRRYLAGEFRQVSIPKEKVKFSTAFVNLNQKIGSDQTSEVYRFNDKTNSGQIIVTTNHEQYKYCKEISTGNNETEISEKPIPYCGWCKREIKHKPIGIPISMEVDRHTNNVVFNVEDTYDKFGCALAALKRIYSCHHRYRDPKYMDAEQLLHTMYHKMYPDKIGTRIKEANDWRLPKLNGGPLDDDEYDSGQYEYVEIPNLVLSPVKRQYIRLNLALGRGQK